ncbi:hypothetical protein J6590_067326 [Homalodisca vitripennis]|nr:hypothetical protein J6590_067326 [Homalodisca vitripennis]
MQLISGLVDCPDLLVLIDLGVPRRTRFRQFSVGDSSLHPIHRTVEWQGFRGLVARRLEVLTFSMVIK